MIDKKIQELKEHDVILERGLRFKIDHIVGVKIPYVKKQFHRKAKKAISLHQPTLSTLAAIAREFLLFDIQEIVELNKPFTDAVMLADKTAEKMARIIAIMAIGVKDPEVFDTQLEDEKTSELARIIFYNVKPIMILRLTQAVRMLCSVENFTDSTNLMSEIRKALPTLVEKEG